MEHWEPIGSLSRSRDSREFERLPKGKIKESEVIRWTSLNLRESNVQVQAIIPIFIGVWSFVVGTVGVVQKSLGLLFCQGISALIANERRKFS